MSSIYEQLVVELRIDPEASTRPLSPARGAPPRPPAGGVFDVLVSPSWNGLRPEDRAFAQPPQDPDWRPGGDG